MSRNKQLLEVFWHWNYITPSLFLNCKKTKKIDLQKPVFRGQKWMYWVWMKCNFILTYQSKSRVMHYNKIIYLKLKKGHKIKLLTCRSLFADKTILTHFVLSIVGIVLIKELKLSDEGEQSEMEAEIPECLQLVWLLAGSLCFTSYSRVSKVWLQ